MRDEKRSLEVIVGDGFEVIAQEFDAQREAINNMNAPVLRELGAIKAMLQEFLKDRVHDREDDKRFRESVNKRLQGLGR